MIGVAAHYDELAQAVKCEFQFLAELGYSPQPPVRRPMYWARDYVSDKVGFRIWADMRGELTADMWLTASAAEHFEIVRFAVWQPFGINAPIMFGGDTRIATAARLLANYVRTNAADALAGEPAAFERARGWQHPQSQLP